MFSERFNLFLIRERTGKTFTLSISSTVFFSCCFALVLILFSNLFYFKSSSSNASLERQLEEANALLIERQNQLVAIASDIVTMKDNLERLQQFNSKLRIMVDMKEPPIEVGIGTGNLENLDLGVIPLHRQELAARKIRTFLNDLTVESQLEEIKQQELLLGIRKNSNMLAAMPSIMPMEGFITSGFGTRGSPFTEKIDFHKGVDVAAKTGTPIVAPARGTVTFTGSGGSYGNTLEISHGSGIVTKYAHLDEVFVVKGQKVNRYDLVASCGSTGRSTGPHLHYEVRINGIPVDPMLYVLN